MHLLLPRNVSVNRTLVETLKKIPLQPSGDRAPHHQHTDHPRRRQDEKVITAAAMTRIPGWPWAAEQMGSFYPAALCCGGVGWDREGAEGARDPSILVSPM